MSLQEAPEIVYRRRSGLLVDADTNIIWYCSHATQQRLRVYGTTVTRPGRPNITPVHGAVHCSAMNSPLEPASPASSSSESLEDDVAMSHEYATSPTHDKSERSGFLANSFAFAKSVAKRRLPVGTTKTTSHRDSKARRREEGSHRKGGPSDRRDPTKGKDDLLDVAQFEILKKSTAVSFDCPPTLNQHLHRNW
jgi:hypothetical protein